MGASELERLLAQRHKDVTMFEYEGRMVPCIILGEKRFAEIMRMVAGRPVSVETNLHILQDGTGHAFVRITMIFPLAQTEETVLLYANEHYDFFEALKETSLMALSSPHSSYGSTNVFMIQLPQPERTESALEEIRKALGREQHP